MWNNIFICVLDATFLEFIRLRFDILEYLYNYGTVNGEYSQHIFACLNFALVTYIVNKSQFAVLYTHTFKWEI